jgi:hypothetical protein
MITDRFSNPFQLLVAGFLLRPYVLACLLAGVAFQGYRMTRPAKADMESLRRQLVEAVCSRAAADLPRRESVSTLAVLELAGDPSGVVSAELKKSIRAAGTHRLLDDAFLGRLLREFAGDGVPVATLAEAVGAARRIGVDAVVFGNVPEFSVGADSGALTVELRMAERETGQAVFARSYRETAGEIYGGMSGWRARMAQKPAGSRILVWAAFTLLLPLVSAPLVLRLTAMESNIINLGMLLGYTAADVAFAAFLTGFRIASLWVSALLLLALAAGAFYNYRIASFIEEKSR